jgi:hypothetical protein
LDKWGNLEASLVKPVVEVVVEHSSTKETLA